MSGTFLEECKGRIAGDVSVQPIVKPAKPLLKAPNKYKVVLLNDDYTPMDFVVNVLQVFFRFDEKAATRMMLQIHQDGKGICGVFTKDIAETKVMQVNQFARIQEHPLLCSMEPT